MKERPQIGSTGCLIIFIIIAVLFVGQYLFYWATTPDGMSYHLFRPVAGHHCVPINRNLGYYCDKGEHP